MFENIRKCLDDFEKSVELFNELSETTTEDKDNVEYFNINFSKAIMKDLYYKDTESIAKIILAAQGLSNEVKVKVE